MHKIELTAHFGDTQKKVELSLPSGTDSGGWHIYIDHLYQGTITKRNGEWVAHLNFKSELTGDEIRILGEIIDAKNNPL